MEAIRFQYVISGWHFLFDHRRCYRFLSVAKLEDACRGLTLRWSQRRLPLEFMAGLSYTTIIELAEPLAGRRGSALDR